MSYGKFVDELNKGIEGYVVAYDNKKEHLGCVLYLKSRPRTIFVPAKIIEQSWEEAIYALRKKIRESEWSEHHLTLVDDGRGMLVFKPESRPESV